jgi:hypothetical protein
MYSAGWRAFNPLWMNCEGRRVTGVSRVIPSDMLIDDEGELLKEDLCEWA